jgi:hypothetical protein
MTIWLVHVTHFPAFETLLHLWIARELSCDGIWRVTMSSSFENNMWWRVWASLSPMFFFLYFLSPPLKFSLTFQSFRMVLLFIKISTLILVILIFNFCFWFFYKILFYFVFNFIFVICYFFNFDLHCFYFFVILLNWLFFSISFFSV